MAGEQAFGKPDLVANEESEAQAEQTGSVNALLVLVLLLFTRPLSPFHLFEPSD